jgi:hypothetical protein
MRTPLRLFRTGQYALAEASQGRRATQRGSCYGSKPAQRVRFGIEHNVIESSVEGVANRRKQYLKASAKTKLSIAFLCSLVITLVQSRIAMRSAT